MTNLLTVQDPDEGASQEATETRALLQAWADKHLPSGDSTTVQPMSDEDIKAHRQGGSEALGVSAVRLGQLTEFAPPTLFGKLLGEFSYATRVLGDQYSLAAQPRELSHAMEGLCREFNRKFFEAGMKWNLHAEYLALASLHVPHRSSGAQDRIYAAHCGNTRIGGHAAPNNIGRRNECEWEQAWTGLQDATEARFEPIADWLITQYGGITIGEEGREYWARQLSRVSAAGFQLHYIDHDGPWVAGFLNLDDACKMRFRRIRLGAYLKEQGMQDGVIRDRVEKAKQEVAGANFTAYPNDTRWEDVYTDGPGSCMASEAHEYECWDDLHPVDAYSSSYHGSGDNSLCLIVSRDAEGNNTGRGILNLQRGSIVRWYGDAVAERVLLRQQVTVDDGYCMEGSWLALLEKGSRFIHPYVDGSLSYGKADGNRVYIMGDHDHPCLQETGGSSYLGDTEYCIDTEQNEVEGNCIYQDISNTYISTECDDWRCPVIGEFSRQYDRVSMNLHGVNVEVAEWTYYNRTQVLTPIGGSGNRHTGPWHIDDDEARAAFFEAYDIEEECDEDEDDEDEEAA